jgi:hypothetical protein
VLYSCDFAAGVRMCIVSWRTVFAAVRCVRVPLVLIWCRMACRFQLPCTLAPVLQRNDDEDAENQLYTLVSHVQITNADGKEINPKGLQTQLVEVSE